AALEHAAAVARGTALPSVPDPGTDSQTYQEAAALVAAVLDLDADIGSALLRAFRRGYLDIPYCIHPDNAGRARSYLHADGWLRWAEIGALPLGHLVAAARPVQVTSQGLLADLSYVRRKFDGEIPELGAVPR